MFRYKLLLFCFLSFLSNTSFAQNSMPSYLEVIREFFSHYSHQREEEYDRIFLAKKKEGWFVNIVDIADHDRVKKEHLFWDIQKNKYIPLTGFGTGLTGEEIDEKIDSFLNGSDPPFLYGYQRCRYYGYDGWDRDMIRDFGGRESLNDTLAEGLGRAYGTYAEKFLWNGVGYGTFNSDSLVKKLGRLEMPNERRIDSFIFYVNRSIDTYRELTKRNSGLKLLVGNSPMKLLNEQVHKYLQLSIAGYKEKVKKAIAELPENDSLYQQIGYAYLKDCPPNSILITFGDNDTYPLWYVQEKKGFRKDVTVLNHSLLGVAPYIDMLKKNNKVAFSSTPAFYGKDRFDYFVYDETGPPNILKTSLPNFLKDIQKRKYPSVQGADTLPAYQVRTIDMKIDLLKLKTISSHPGLLPGITIELSDYILLNDFMILDIINSNIHSRPIYFTSSESSFPSKYLQHEGSLYRVLPLNEKFKETNLKISISKIEEYLLKNPKPVLAVYYDPFEYYENTSGQHSALFAKLINYYSNKNNSTKADEWALKYLTSFDPTNIHYNLSDITIAEALLRTSFEKKGVSLMENIATNLREAHKEPAMLTIFNGKETYKNWLEYLNSVLRKNKSSSEILEKLIEKAGKETEEGN